MMPDYQKKYERPEFEMPKNIDLTLFFDKVREFNEQYKNRKPEDNEDPSKLSLSDLDSE